MHAYRTYICPLTDLKWPFGATFSALKKKKKPCGRTSSLHILIFERQDEDTIFITECMRKGSWAGFESKQKRDINSSPNLFSLLSQLLSQVNDAQGDVNLGILSSLAYYDNYCLSLSFGVACYPVQGSSSL